MGAHYPFFWRHVLKGWCISFWKHIVIWFLHMRITHFLLFHFAGCAVVAAGDASAAKFLGRDDDGGLPDADAGFSGGFLKRRKGLVFLAGAVSPGQAGSDLLMVDVDAVAVDDGNGLFLPVGIKGLIPDVFSGAQLFQCTGRLDGLGLARFGRINAGKPDSDGLVLVEYGQGIAAADAEQGGCTGRHKAVCQQAGCEEEAAGRRHGAGFLQGKRKL